MISGEEIAKYIEAPNSIRFENISDLKLLIDKYPYASTVHILYLKAIALANHLDFEFVLKKTAGHVHDRSQLYQIINTRSDIQEKTIEEKEAKKTTQPTTEKETTVIKTTVNTGQKVSTPVNETKAEELKEQTITQPDNLDVEILNKAIDVGYVDSNLQVPPAEHKVQPKEDTAKNNSVQEEKIILKQAEEKEQLKENTFETTNKPLSFVEWLKAKKAGNTKTNLTEVSKEKSENNVQKRPINELLDKFIEEEPSISRPVKDFFSPSKNAKKSIEETDDLVTETLAKIYVLQKNYKKAIAAYKQLILLYPEKKTFFASQIEKLNNNLK